MNLGNKDAEASSFIQPGKQRIAGGARLEDWLLR